MLRRLPPALLLVALVLPTCAVETGQDEDTTIVRLVVLQHADAVSTARAFGGGEEGGKLDLEAGRRDFVRRALEAGTRGVRPYPEMLEPGLYPFEERNFAEVRPAQLPGGGGALAGFLPEGLSEPPQAVPLQNALLVRGTPVAIDEFREVLALIDKPARQVNIELKLVNLLESVAWEWGRDIDWTGRSVGLSFHGPAPVGSALRYGRQDTSVLEGYGRRSGFANTSVAANVTTTNNTPCVIRAARVIPFVTASVSYNVFGVRQVDYVVDAVMTGVELFVLPRINGDDSVTMLLRPSFIDKAGQVVGPDGAVIPITEEIAADTVVTVPDGQTLMIGGLPRSSQTLATAGFPINFRQSAMVEDVETLLFVTPRIVRTLPQ